MAYIQREGGERFVIPSYRDVIAKRKSRLKDDLLELSAKYGEFLCFQRRGLAQFEVAFSHEAGYLFGECVWSFFKNPKDLIYCEAIPETTEAYLVVVKNGAVYLDGQVPIENISEELLIFTTQKNHFEIYVYGDVPLSPEPQEGKFSFDPGSVKLFSELDAPLFQQLPAAKAYQLKLVDVVLREQGIGVFPIKYVLAAVVILGMAWMGYSYVHMHKKKMPRVVISLPAQNPYLEFNKTLATPAPDLEIKNAMAVLAHAFTLPGWVIMDLEYKSGMMHLNVKSLGANTATLLTWADMNQFKVEMNEKGYALVAPIALPPERRVPKEIFPLELVVSSLVDRVALVLPGNVLQLSPIAKKGSYSKATVSINLSEVSPETVIILTKQLRDMPLVLTGMKSTINHGLTGTITLQALGS